MGDQDLTVPVTYYRGGTSKALFFHERDVLPPGPSRDNFLRRIMGSPDPMQIDGMGGTHVVTSKIALIRPSTRSDADVDYIFVQVGIKSDDIGYTGNCGNISSAVGPFAISEGLIKEKREGMSVDPAIKTQEVRIFNTGTKKILISHVPINQRTGKPLEAGSFAIDGCPRTGAPILMDYKNVVGATLGGSIIPTGHAVDEIEVGGKTIPLTLCDVGNLIIFAYAKDLGLAGNETASSLDEKDIIAKVKEIRGKGAQLVGMCKDWSRVDIESPMLPMVALLSHATDGKSHIQSRLFLDNKCHTAMAGTGSICHTACSRVPGSLVNQLISKDALQEKTFNIQHPSGTIPVAVETKSNNLSSSDLPEFITLSFIRTARRIWKGELDVPEDFQDEYLKASDHGSVSNGVQHTNGVGKVNGVSTNGHLTNGEKVAAKSSNGVVEESPSVTKDFSQFVHGTTPSDLNDAVIIKLKELLLDYIGVGIAGAELGNSSIPFLNGVSAIKGNQEGVATVFGQKQLFPQPLAALLNGAYAHTLDFDDTYAPGALHPGVTVISAALAQAESIQDLDPLKLLTALAVGYEIACRLGKALGSGAYSRGFHNTATVGIFGAVATIAKLRNLDVTTIENALGLALSKAAGSMQYLENGSWNKRLHPGFAAHDAFLSVTLAEAGVVGAAKAFEGKYGFLHAYSGTSSVEGLTDKLRSRWEFLQTGVKPFPACRMTHGQIEAVSDLATKHSRQPVGRIIIALSKSCFPVVGAPTPNKIHPLNIVDAQFSSYYQSAVAYLFGSATGWRAYDLLNDKEVHDLSEKISVEVDETLQGLQSRVEIQWLNGEKESQTVLAPIGEPENPLMWNDLLDKLNSLVNPIRGKEVSKNIATVVKDLESYEVSSLTSLLK